MRMMLKVSIPVKYGNKGVNEGILSADCSITSAFNLEEMRSGVAKATKHCNK